MFVKIRQSAQGVLFYEWRAIRVAFDFSFSPSGVEGRFKSAFSGQNPNTAFFHRGLSLSEVVVFFRFSRSFVPSSLPV